MKKKKLALAIVGLASMVTLAACSGGKDLVTMKGGKITVDEFFDEIKTSQEVQTQLQYAIIFKVADQNFGDKVTKEQIQAKYDEQAEQFGDTFKDQLKAANLTEATYKETIKKGLSFEEMKKSHIKIEDADLKETWKTYHPAVDAQIFATDDEKVAKDALAAIKKGDDFGKLAKEKSSDATAAKDGKVTFDSTDATVPPEVKEAAYKLKDGTNSEIIEVASSNGMEEIKVYYIVKMVKNQEKGNDWKPFKKELTDITMEAKLADQTIQQEVISKELKKANIKIQDDSLKSVLAGYIEEETKDSKKDETKDSKKDDSKKDETKESTK